jgi:hypothetical protein
VSIAGRLYAGTTLWVGQGCVDGDMGFINSGGLPSRGHGLVVDFQGSRHTKVRVSYLLNFLPLLSPLLEVGNLLCAFTYSRESLSLTTPDLANY